MHAIIDAVPRALYLGLMQHFLCHAGPEGFLDHLA